MTKVRVNSNNNNHHNNNQIKGQQKKSMENNKSNDGMKNGNGKANIKSHELVQHNKQSKGQYYSKLNSTNVKSSKKKEWRAPTLPTLAIIWTIITIPIVLIDATFVLTRASVSAKEALHPLANIIPFKYWVLYSKYDRRYDINDDAFVIVQSILNIVEVLLAFTALLINSCTYSQLSIKLMIITSLMTVYKTVMYFMMDVVEGGKYTNHNAFKQKMNMVILPSSLWIIFPGIILFQCFRLLTKS